MSAASGHRLRPGPVVGLGLALGHVAGAVGAALTLAPFPAVLVVTGLGLSLLGCWRGRTPAGTCVRVARDGRPTLVDATGRATPLTGTVVQPWLICVEPAGARARLVTGDAVSRDAARHLRRALRWGGGRGNVHSVAVAER